MAEKVVELVKEKEYEYVISELSMSHTYTDQDIMLEGTMDILFRTKEWDYVIVDIKTAKSNWTDEHAQAVKQKIIYPVLFAKKYWKDIKRFEYRVLTKTSNPELYQFCSDVSEDAHQQVMEILEALRKAEETQTWEPSYPNYSCRYCPLKGKCQNYKVIE